MAPIFRLQEEEPRLLTDTEQQEHFGNEAARTTRAGFNRLGIIRIAPGNTTFGVIVTSTNIYKFIEASRAARCPSILRL
ncbi:hypothetical protein [Bradyrhizobium sp. Arg816]|uniref:hypothetical protein n=1 Tax=Bradyrhizobium sp. Arg816 TaxID=2998491 RepID=UPI00249F4DD9|nr:hypothetical protein [Bradyrhizobium sp. Arg816]MDI3567323.1 hypothetical protein [Bradyrhizobium sp. Arg816]